jgi:hypothetical protein
MTSRRCKSFTRPDRGKGLAKRTGIVVRLGFSEAGQSKTRKPMNENPIRGVRARTTGMERRSQHPLGILALMALKALDVLGPLHGYAWRGGLNRSAGPDSG